MLLRNSISSTRKFFKRTLGNFKSLFSGDRYQKLPKSPLSTKTAGDTINCNSQQLSFKGMENLYSTETSTTQNKVTINNDHITDDCQSCSTISENNKMKKKNKKLEDHLSANNDCDEYSRDHLVEQKLKELEMLDISNVDHVLDIEEVLHYYSRLTCPAYLQIVDKFFAEILSEFFNAGQQL